MSATMTFAVARSVVDAMRRVAVERGVPSAYAVVDAGGNLVVFEVDDGVILAARDLAIGKAWTSLALAEPTSGLPPQVEPGGPFYGLVTSLRDHALVPFAGGQPLGLPVVGGCGVSGGELDDDEAISLAGRHAFEAQRSAK